MRGNAHIIEQLRKLCQCPLDLLDVRMTFLHFAVCGPGLTVTVRVHQRLAEDLATLVIIDNSFNFVWRCIGLYCIRA